LVFADLAKSHSSRAVTVGLLDATCSWGALAGRCKSVREKAMVEKVVRNSTKFKSSMSPHFKLEPYLTIV
jgi:hypothetical protein